MAIYVGRWDCNTCGTIGNLGPETRCPNCGTSRPEDVQFYLASETDVVRDQKQEAEAKAGVDWRCGHCSSHNKAGITVCQTCGNPRDQLSEDVDLDVKTYRTDQVPTQTDKGPSSREVYDETARRHKAGRFRNLRPIMWLATIGLLAIILSGFYPSDVTAEVTGFSWERSTSMEHYEAVAYEDWNTPSGAFDVRSFSAVHHYEKEYSHTETRYRDVRVQVGTESYVCGKIDMGNGYFQDRYCSRPVYTTRTEPYRYEVYRDVPIYRTKYAFKVMQWVAKPGYTLKAQGDDHHARWPEPPATLQGEDWRKGKSVGQYFVTVQYRKPYTEEVGPRYWESLNTGSEVKARKAWLYGSWYGLSDPAHRE
ncbi:MAG: zinc finger Ran-binding domain-containing protein [Bacteroidia bacterium]